MEPTQYLFVCTGNTCRSPMAAALLTMLLERCGRFGRAESAGLAACAGEPASANAVAAMAEFGYDLTAHRAKPLSRELVEKSSLILTMTPRHAQAVLAAFPEFAGRVEVLGEGIPDPFGGGMAEYRGCRDALLAALRRRTGLLDHAVFTITPMQPCHLDSLAALEALCFSRPWSRELLFRELENPLAVFLVAESEGAAAGYAGLHFVEDEGYIDNIAVHPLYRRLGAASALLDAFDAFALKQGLSFLTLEVRQSNDDARRLYEKHGYSVAGNRRDYYTQPVENAVLMTKRFRSLNKKEFFS